MADMPIIKHEVHLGSSDEDVKRVVIKQANDYTHVLVIRLYADDDQYVLNPAWNYNITMKKSDGTYIVNSSNITVEDIGTQSDPDWTINVVCTQQMLSAPGNARAEVVVYNDNQVLFTNTFYVYIEEDVVPEEVVESTNEFKSLVDVLRQIQQYAANAETSATSAATSANNASTSAQNSANYEQQIRAILDSLGDYTDQLEQILSTARSEGQEISDIGNDLRNNVDDINAQIDTLQEQVNDILTNVVNNVNTIYQEIQNKDSEINDLYMQFQGLITTATETNNTLQTSLNETNNKLADINNKYNDFLNNIEEANGYIATLQENVDASTTMLNNITNVTEQINSYYSTIQEQIDGINADYLEAESIIERLRELAEEAEHSGTLFDPIIVSADEPEADAQTTDDMWLEPYGDDEEPESEPETNTEPETEP